MGMSNRWSSVRVLIGVSVLWLPLSMLFNSVQSLVLPVYVVRFVPRTQQATALGLLLFVGLAAGALVQPLVGAYSDRLRQMRWGRRQPLIVVGTLATLAFLAGFGLASNLWALAAAYVSVSVAAGIAQAGLQGLMPDLIPAQRRGGASGLKGLLELSGSLVGFSVAGVLIKKGNPGGALVAIGMLLVLGVLGTLALVREGRRTRLDGVAETRTQVTPNAGPVTTLARESAQERLPEPDPASGPRGQFVRVLASRFLFLLGVYGIGHFLLFFVQSRLHFATATAAAAATGGLFAGLTLATAIMALSGGFLSDRIGRVPVLWVAAATSALGTLLLIPASSLGGIFAGGLIMSIGSGLFASANWALSADLTPKGNGGRFFGLVALATGGATAVAGLLGPVVDHLGFTALFLVAAGAFAGSVVVLPGRLMAPATAEIARA